MPVNAPNNNLDILAPSFSLKNIDNKILSLDSLKGVNGTVIVFICNHCPYVIAIAERLSYEANELSEIGINTIAIMSNDVKQYPEDSFEKMKSFAKKYNFSFPYLYDENQSVANNFEAVCTPDFFGFNSLLELQYRGRIDSGVMNSKYLDMKRELYEAMQLIIKTGRGPEKQFNSFGCSIKWKEKHI